MNIEESKNYLLDKIKSKLNLRVCRIESSSQNQWETIDYLKKEFFFHSLDYEDFNLECENLITNYDYCSYERNNDSYSTRSNKNNNNNNKFNNTLNRNKSNHTNNNEYTPFLYQKPFTNNNKLKNKSKYRNESTNNLMEPDSNTNNMFDNFSNFSESKHFIKVKT